MMSNHFIVESSYEGYAMITIPEPKAHPPYNVFSDITYDVWRSVNVSVII